MLSGPAVHHTTNQRELGVLRVLTPGSGSGWAHVRPARVLPARVLPKSAHPIRGFIVEGWTAPLATGDPEAAWDLFIERYRRLICSAIRHYTADSDDLMDAFAFICESLRSNDFARLRRCAVAVDPQRPFSTWLVVTVRNLTIDWFRHQVGRPRLPALAASLPPLQRRIFQYVFVEQRPHVEAYELVRTRDDAALRFGEFLEALRATYRAATSGPGRRMVAELALPPPPPTASPDPWSDDPAVRAEQRAMVNAALASIQDDDRLIVQLYIVDEMSAEDVARALGYANVKTVYNRVYRALAAIRARLAKAGITREDV